MKQVSKNSDYELLDSGEGEKLERYGSVVLSRPDPQALWRKHLPETEWKNAHATFVKKESGGEWKYKKEKLDKWQIEYAGLKFWIKPTAFKHTGIFPEHIANWDWMREILKNNEGAEVLNLFGYTGGATLACAEANAKVVHVDGSKSAITWARENAEISLLKDKPIRWILEDARVFVRREINRGNKYDGIIMDPPAFGHGAKKEVWKIEEDFLLLVEDCFKILKDKPLFFLINGYSAGYSSIAYNNILLPLVEKFGGSIEIGELTIEEKETERLLPCGIFARWRG
jgi:23S rRNA (cytosine1962-C5)-methyltransferase